MSILTSVRRRIPAPIKQIYRVTMSRYELLLASYRKWRLLRPLRGDNVECNVCSWRGARFISDGWHDESNCPNCGSDVRHRLLQATLFLIPQFSAKSLFTEKDVLHFAAEPALMATLSPLAHRYVRAGLNAPDIDLNVDM